MTCAVWAGGAASVCVLPAALAGHPGSRPGGASSHPSSQPARRRQRPGGFVGTPARVARPAEPASCPVGCGAAGRSPQAPPRPTWLASLTASMISISPDAGQIPYLPRPLQVSVAPSLGSIQNAGHRPVPAPGPRAPLAHRVPGRWPGAAPRAEAAAAAGAAAARQGPPHPRAAGCAPRSSQSGTRRREPPGTCQRCGCAPR